MIHRQTISLTEADLRNELDWFEKRYGVPSDRLEEAFTHDGVLDETDDFARWQMVRGVHNVLRERNRALRRSRGASS